jgi:hypothetical protein
MLLVKVKGVVFVQRKGLYRLQYPILVDRFDNPEDHIPPPTQSYSETKQKQPIYLPCLLDYGCPTHHFAITGNPSPGCRSALGIQ